MIRLQGRDVAGGGRVMPRCEAYGISLSVAPITDRLTHRLDEECMDQQYM